MKRIKAGFVSGTAEEFLEDIGAAPKQWRFRLPMPPNTANERGHWRTRHQARKAYFAHLDILLAGKILPPPPEAPMQKAIITAKLTLWNPMDEGNAMHRAEKLPCDWLKTRGYIVDDSRKHLKWGGIPEQRITRKNEPCLELTLEAA